MTSQAPPAPPVDRERTLPAAVTVALIAARAAALIVCGVLLAGLDQKAWEYGLAPDFAGLGAAWAGMGLVVAAFTLVVVAGRQGRTHWLFPGIEVLLATALLAVTVLLGPRPQWFFLDVLIMVNDLAPLAGVWLAVAAVSLARTLRRR